MSSMPALNPDQVEHFRQIAKLPIRPWEGNAPADWVSSLEVDFHDADKLMKKSPSRSELFSLWRDSNIPTENCFLSTMAWGGMRAGHGRSIWKAKDAWLPVCEKLRSGQFDNREEAFEAFRVLRQKNKLPGMGPAYFTKVLFFARPVQDAYILDQWTARSIHVLTQNRAWPAVQIDWSTLKRMKNANGGAKNIRVTVTDRVTSADYEHYCKLVEELAVRSDMTACQVEEIMFGQGGKEPTRWRSHIMESWYAL